MLKIMTPGPVQVPEKVRLARSKPTTNPDLDLSFYDFYKTLCERIGNLVKQTSNYETLILSGEGILGLEAACVSLIEPGDRVLVLDNGIFGKGFEDFVKMYGGEAVLFSSDYKKGIDADLLKAYLDKDSNFKCATLVHCDTPTGVLNDIAKISAILKSYNILTICDSVSCSFGEHIDLTEESIDILCMASQKVVSAPPGLTILTVSNTAVETMIKRKTPISSYYLSILTYKGYYEKKWFPYTMPISDIYGLEAAIEIIEEDSSIITRHRNIANATRAAITASGLSLYLENDYSSTVTVINVPQGLTASQITTYMKDNYAILIAGCFDFLSEKVIRIGHMGENANAADVEETLTALDKTFYNLGVSLNCKLSEYFKAEFSKANKS